MKAFTIWQPWASLIMVGAKPYEFRPKSYLRYVGAPAIGERIVIHAGVRPVRRAEIEDLLEQLDETVNITGLVPEIARPLLRNVLAAYRCQLLPLGCGLGTAVIGKPRNAGEIFGRGIADSDRQAADHDAYNWAWPLSEISPWDEPIRQPGAQGFWKWPHRTEGR
jgi:hypothetical protein